MGRIGITYDQVAAAADALLSETGGATLKAVRERLGTGGMGTIHKHLAAWTANRPKGPAPTVELPQELVRGLSAWVAQSATAARSDAEERLVQAQAEAMLLSQAGEQLEAERDALLDQSVVLTTERDRALATATERASEIERMAKDVERERALAGEAQIEAAAARLKLESQHEQLADMRASLARLNDALDTERQARGQAETRAAVLQAELGAAQKEAERERDDTRAVQAQLHKALLDSEKARDAYEGRIQDLDRASKEAITAERVATDKARTEAQAAALQVADLRVRLVAAEEKVAHLEAMAEKAEKKAVDI